MSLISRQAKKASDKPVEKTAEFDLGDTSNPDRWSEGYHAGADKARNNVGSNDYTGLFSDYQAQSRSDSYSAGWVAGWLDYMDMGHDRMREFSSTTGRQGSKTASNGWDRDTDLDGLEDSWKDYGDGIYGQVVFRDGLGFVGWVEDQNSGEEYAHEIGGSIDEVERALDQTVESQGIIAVRKKAEFEDYSNGELGTLYADLTRALRDGWIESDEVAETEALLDRVEDELEARGHPRSAKTSKKRGNNPVGKKVIVKSGPDAGLTGLVSRVASSGFFVEIEDAEAGPYRPSNLAIERTPKTSKKTASFAGQYVWVEVDGEWIQGFVHEDDGGPTVEVSDPEDDPYMVGAPAEVPREQVFREIPNTAKKASKTAASTNAELVREALDEFFLLDMAEPGDDNYLTEKERLRISFDSLSHRGFGLADKAATALESDDLDTVDDLLYQMAESVGLPKFTKKAARGRSWEGFGETGAVVRFVIEQSPLGWLLRKFVKSDPFLGDMHFKQTFTEDGNDSVEAARATAQQMIDSEGLTTTHDWYDSV